jgi:hypothetical protein
VLRPEESLHHSAHCPARENFTRSPAQPTQEKSPLSGDTRLRLAQRLKGKLWPRLEVPRDQIEMAEKSDVALTILTQLPTQHP